jgi:hypothetical protein
MKKIITILTLFLFHTALASAQCVSGPAPSPRTVVEQLWMMATQGDLLTSEGWDKAAKSLFLDPNPTPPATNLDYFGARYYSNTIDGL